MTVLVTADLHLDDNPKNADRWNLFPWLAKQVTKTGAKHVLLLGDITDAKDRHNARLVNKLAECIHGLAQKTDVIWLTGNHDYINSSLPFFSFVKLLDGRVTFINEPMEQGLDDGIGGDRNIKACIFLPSTRNYEEDWKGINFNTGEGLGGGSTKDIIKYVFCHQTFDGSLAENGTALRGIPPSVFADFKGQVIAGDIHVPQKIGKNIFHVGAPYRVHFGDSFTPRVILLRKGEMVDLHFPAKGRELIAVHNMDELEYFAYDIGTQVKIRMKKTRAEFAEWPELRKDIIALAGRRGWELCGLELVQVKERDRQIEGGPELKLTSPEEVLMDYAVRKHLEKPIRNAGLEFLRGAQQ